MKSVEDFLKEHKAKNIENSQSNRSQSNGKKEESLCYNIQENKVKNDCLEEKKENDLQEFDKLKTRILKYVLYKKRTEKEVRQKFASSYDENIVEEVIQNLKNNGYIDDEKYIERAVKEYQAIYTLSQREIRNKLYTKGLSSSIIENYFSLHKKELQEYEITCSKKIVLKKQMQMDEQEIEQFLRKKGYQTQSIRQAFEEQ